MSSLAFLDRSFHIRWSQLTPDRVEPSIDKAMAEAETALNQIAAQPEESLNFERTFLALEEATEALGEAWGKVGHLVAVADAPALREAHHKVLPRVAEFFAGIPLRDDLWRVLRAYASTPQAEKLPGVRRRFLEETMADFRQHGADLPAEKKERLKAIESELSEVTHKYAENVLDATNAWDLVIDSEEQLRGLPEAAREAARRNALARKIGSEEQPRWRFTLQQPSVEPFMTYLEDEGLRRKMWEALAAVGASEPYDNTGLVRRILALRREKADLLGKPHFADLVLERRMARTGEEALAFVEKLHARVSKAFAGECRELEAFKAEQTGSEPGALAPWELAFWAEKLRRQRYAFDEEELRPYFPLDRVIEGMFAIARRIFGIDIIERRDVDPGEVAAGGAVEVWHPEVRFYELRDEDGTLLGSFYADWHPRESKRGGAWMNHLITGGPDGTVRRPHLGLICGNLTPPAGERPAQLKHREVETIFHEFGHLLHHLLGEVEIKSLNGVNVAWDFVELPSQIMENWCWEREGLDLFARHFSTGEPIPEELFSKMVAARNFRSAGAMMRQLSFARLDLALHMRPDSFWQPDLEERAREYLSEYTVPTRPESPTLLRRFNHIFGDPVGYAGGYYSYKWAEVLDADAFTRFQREGIFNPAVGMEFRRKILSRGNAEHPMKLYEDFMGRPPELEPLLIRSGLA